MTTNHGHDGGGARNPSVGFDRSDLSARGILIFFVVLAISVVAVLLCVLGMYFGMTRISEKHEKEVSPLAPNTVTPRAEILMNTADVNVEQFPQPRLLRHIRGSVGDLGEMTKFLTQEALVLTAKPWQDSEGNVHLPIEQAMKEVVPRLPVRAGISSGNQSAVSNSQGTSSEYANEISAASAGAPQDEGDKGETENPATPK